MNVGLAFSVFRKRPLPAFVIIPILILTAGAAGTGIAVQLLKEDAKADARLRLESRANELRNSMEARLRAYEQVVLGTGALIEASPGADRKEFHTYIDSLHLSSYFPGIQGVGFALSVPPERKLSVEAQVTAEGFPSFRIWPPGERNLYTTVIYLEPFTDRNLRAFGYDMLSEPTRRAAMELAMVEDETTISGPVRLMQETTTDVQTGFLMFVPVFRPANASHSPSVRRANLYGWVFAPFRMGDFMQGVLRSEYGEVSSSLDLHILDQDGTTMFDSGPDDPREETAVETTRQVHFGARTWKITLRGTNGYAVTADTRSRMILAGIAGTGATISVAAVLWFLLGRTARQEQDRRRWMNAASMDGFWLVDLDGRIIETNDAYCRMSGYSREEILARSIKDFETIEDQADIRERIHSIAANGSDRFESEHKRKDGTIFPVEVSVRFLPGERGRLVSFLRDITERKKAEQALRHSESRFRNLVQSLREVVYTLDADGRYTGVYGSWMQGAGLTAEDFLGKTAREILGDAAAVVHESALEKALRGDFVVYEWSLGESFFETSLAPLDDDGTIVGVVGIGRDVTERERMKQALERNEKLQSIGNLAGGLAHDFNNLLGGIFGHIEAAAELAQQPQQRMILKRAMETMDRARKLTGQLLTFSRAGKPDTRHHEMPDFLRKAVEFSLSGSGMKALYTFPDKPPVAIFDAAQIEQVVDNLVINARQASRNSGILYISAETVENTAGHIPDLPNGSFVRVTVRDTGPGMTAEVRDHVFDPFFSTKGEGRGLGLATAFSIVRRHGGTMTVDASPEGGASFSIYLPRGETPVPIARQMEEHVDSSNARLLLMDDEPSMRESLSELLQMKGYAVDAAGEGAQALRMYHEAVQNHHPYSALILDLTVPGAMGGLALAEEIRKIDVHTPIILMSGYAADFETSALEPRKINATLTKPFTIAQLISAVEGSIQKNTTGG